VLAMPLGNERYPVINGVRYERISFKPSVHTEYVIVFVELNPIDEATTIRLRDALARDDREQLGE
jgi:hypothetical protein